MSFLLHKLTWWHLQMLFFCLHFFKIFKKQFKLSWLKLISIIKMIARKVLKKYLWRSYIQVKAKQKKKTRSRTAVDPQHLKVKEWGISLTKNYCITINIKIISSIHVFILKIQVLGSHELKKQSFLTRPTQKWLNQLSAFLHLY